MIIKGSTPTLLSRYDYVLPRSPSSLSYNIIAPSLLGLRWCNDHVVAIGHREGDHLALLLQLLVGVAGHLAGIAVAVALGLRGMRVSLIWCYKCLIRLQIFHFNVI